jgi:hypothetical protein
MKGKITRLYNMSDPDLSQKGDVIGNLAERDIEKFELFKFMPEDLVRFRALVANFKDIGQDLYYEGLKMGCTEEKHASRSRLMNAIRPIRERMKLAFGINSALYKSHKFAVLTKLPDEMLYVKARRIHKTAMLKTVELEKAGMTPAMLAAIETENALFLEKTDELDFAHYIREEKTEERIVCGNAVYAEMAMICEIGKSIWRNESPAKFNEYVIYQPSPGKAVVTGNITDSGSGEPIVRASVSIEELDNREVYTDERGNYAFIDIQPAAYTFIAEAALYLPLRKEKVNVTADKAMILNFALVRS